MNFNRAFYDRKKSKTNRVLAIKALAHKLARACYHILRDQTDRVRKRARLESVGMKVAGVVAKY